MKFFLDTANLEDIGKGTALGIVDGVTTNPSLIAKEGIAIEEQIRRICDITDKGLEQFLQDYNKAFERTHA